MCMYHTQETPFWCCFLLLFSRENTHEVNIFFLLWGLPERKRRGKSERDVSRLHFQERIFRQLKNNPLHIPKNFSVKTCFYSILYGAAVYFFLADDDLQQREWIFVAV